MKQLIFFFLLVIVCLLISQSCTPLTNLEGASARQTPYQYGCKGDGKANDIIGMQAYFDNNKIVEIPSGTFSVNGDLHLKGDKTLILTGTLNGVKGNERIFTDGDIIIKGKGTFQRFSIEVLGGSFEINDVKFLNAGRSAAILINNDDKIVTNLYIDGVEILKGPYGVLRQGAFGEKKVEKAIIRNCYIHDCRGDGIEWNVGYRDGPILIENNRIENLNSDIGGQVGKAWGMGIGVAGAANNDKYKRHVRNFKVINNQVINVRHGIHIEAGSDFEISGNKVVVNPNQSSKGTLAIVGIVTYACTDFTISDNEVIAKGILAIWNSFGSLPKIGYLAPPRNYIVKNNKVEGRVNNWCSGKDNKVETIDNEIAGDLQHFGAATHIIKNNIIYSTSDMPDLKVDFFFQGTGKRKAYNALPKDAILIEENNFRDKNGNDISKILKLNK